MEVNQFSLAMKKCLKPVAYVNGTRGVKTDKKYFEKKYHF